MSSPNHDCLHYPLHYLSRILDPEETSEFTEPDSSCCDSKCCHQYYLEKRKRKHMNTTIEFETQQKREIERKIVMDVQEITKILPLGREQIEILKGISFQILSGEFISIVGPSGSGKSTLLAIIAGLDNPTTGHVLIDSVDITHMTES